MDEKLLRHILSNLLSNAIKYSPKAAHHFELICQQGSDFQDEGIGIPTDQAQLFDIRSIEPAMSARLQDRTGVSDCQSP